MHRSPLNSSHARSRDRTHDKSPDCLVARSRARPLAASLPRALSDFEIDRSIYRSSDCSVARPSTVPIVRLIARSLGIARLFDRLLAWSLRRSTSQVRISRGNMPPIGRTVQQHEPLVYISGTEKYRIGIRMATCLPMLSRYYKFGPKLDALRNKRGNTTASRELCMLALKVLNVIEFTTMLISWFAPFI